MNIREYIYQNEKIDRITNNIIEASNHNNIYIGNSSNNFSKMLVTSYFLKTNKTTVYLTSNIYHATKAYDVFLEFLGKEKVSFFPGDEFISQEMVASSNMFRLARMDALKRIINNEPSVLVINIEGALKNVMSKNSLKQSIMHINVGDIYSKDKIINDLVIRGYKKQIVTEVQGTFSVRGEVLDIFPVNEDDPIRINFFDDEIETIKKFNVSTQMSNVKINEIDIFPLYEMYYNEIETIKSSIIETQEYNDKLKDALFNLENYENLDQLYIYLPYIDHNYQNILDLISDKTVFFEEYNQILDKQEMELSEIKNYIETINHKLDSKFLHNIVELTKNTKKVYLNNMLSNIVDIKFDYFENFFRKPLAFFDDMWYHM